MAHELYKLQAKLSNRPQLMEIEAFESISAYLSDSANREIRKVGLQDEDGLNPRYQIVDDAAQFIIQGPTTYRPVTFAGMDCGGFSYQQFKADFKEAVSKGIKTAAFLIDSPGGEAHQAFASADYVRKLADENGVKIIAYVDGVAASAGYAWAAIADEIIMAPSSEVGSIGVVVRLYNDSKKLEKDGYERIFVTAGADKVPFDPDGKFKQSFLDDLKAKVDVVYTEFVGHVAKHRDISEEVVRSTEANTFLPEQAIKLGLADKVMTVEEFHEYFSELPLPTSQTEPKEELMPKPKLTDMFSLNKGKPDMKLEELQAALQAKELEMTALASQLTELTSQVTSLQDVLGQKETALTEALAKVAEAEASAEAQKKEAKLKEREQALLGAGLSAEDAKAQATSLESLDDATFETVLAGFAKQAAALQTSQLFTQMSTTAEPEKIEKAKTSAEEAVEATRKAMQERGLI